MKPKKIYLYERDEYVGPFQSRADAERFLALIALFGGTCRGIEVVETDGDLQCAGMSSRRFDPIPYCG